MGRRMLYLGVCACVLVSTVAGCTKPTSLSDALQERADEAIAEAAPGAYLTSIGTSGLALSDDPHEWTYMYYDPDTKHLWRVFVHKGEQPELTDMGAGNAQFSERIPADEVHYSASEAIELARAEAERSGVTVPQNVMASGSYASVEGGEEFGLKQGVWSVTFATGTSLDDAVTYEVDMRDGATEGPITED